MTYKIPKIIHQIWYQGVENIPNDYPNYSSTWKKYNPDYQYVLWDKNMIETLIQQKFPFFMNKYHSFPKMIQKIDSAKCLILYTYGGLYVDMDSECLKNIDNLLNNEIILVKCNMDLLQSFFFYGTTNFIIQNGFMGSTKRNLFWIKCIDLIMKEDINKKFYEMEEVYIFRTAGPSIITNAYHSDINNKKYLLLDHNYIDPLTSCEYEYYKCGSDNCTRNYPNAYAFHHYGAKHTSNGWLPETSKYSLIFFCKYQSYIYIIFVLMFLAIIIFIFYR